MAEQLESRYIIEKFETLKKDFIVLSKKDLLILQKTSKKLYHEYLAMLDVYLVKIKFDDKYIAKSDPKQVFEDLDIKQSPAEEAAEEVLKTQKQEVKDKLIQDLTEDQFLTLIASGTQTICNGILTSSEQPFIMKVTKQDITDNSKHYQRCENLWKGMFGNARDAGMSTKRSSTGLDGTVGLTYTMYIMYDETVECRNLDKNDFEKYKQTKFKTKYKR